MKIGVQTRLENGRCAYANQPRILNAEIWMLLAWHTHTQHSFWTLSRKYRQLKFFVNSYIYYISFAINQCTDFSVNHRYFSDWDQLLLTTTDNENHAISSFSTKLKRKPNKNINRHQLLKFTFLPASKREKKKTNTMRK